MTKGCICCTLREDLLQELGRPACEGRFDYLVIESTGVSEPLPVTQTFADEAGRSLQEITRLDTMVTVIDTANFLSHYADGPVRHCAETQPTPPGASGLCKSQTTAPHAISCAASAASTCLKSSPRSSAHAPMNRFEPAMPNYVYQVVAVDPDAAPETFGDRQSMLEEPSNVFYSTFVFDDVMHYEPLPPAFWLVRLDALQARPAKLGLAQESGPISHATLRPSSSP